MPFVDEQASPEITTRPGIFARVVANKDLGANGATVIMVRAVAGAKVPLHAHRVEETVSVFEGKMWAVIGDQRIIVGPNQTIIFPSDAPHAWGTDGADEVKMVRVYSGPEPFKDTTYFEGGPPNLAVKK